LAPLAKIVFNAWRIDVMGWLTAIGTVGAVVVALWLALLDRFRRRKAARWHQAEQLTCWLGFGVNMGQHGPVRGKAYASESLVWKPGDPLDKKEGGWVDGGRRFFRAVMIQNASPQVVYSVIVTLVRDHHGRGRGERMAARTMIGEVPPGLTESRIEILDVGTVVRRSRWLSSMAGGRQSPRGECPGQGGRGLNWVGQGEVARLTPSEPVGAHESPREVHVLPGVKVRGTQHVVYRRVDLGQGRRPTSRRE